MEKFVKKLNSLTITVPNILILEPKCWTKKNANEFTSTKFKTKFQFCFLDFDPIFGEGDTKPKTKSIFCCYR